MPIVPEPAVTKPWWRERLVLDDNTIRWVEVPALEFVNGTDVAKCIIIDGMIKAGWPAHVKMTIESGRTIDGNMVWLASIPSEHVEDTQRGKLQMVHLRMASRVMILVGIPGYVKQGEYLSTTISSVEHKVKAVLRELVRTYGWPSNCICEEHSYSRGRLVTIVNGNSGEWWSQRADVITDWGEWDGAIAGVDKPFHGGCHLQIEQAALEGMLR